MIARTPSTSSMLQDFGHDAATGELHTIFRRTPKRLYIYETVPADLHAALRAADSHGRFMQQFVIGKFPHRIVELDDDGNPIEQQESAGAR